MKTARLYFQLILDYQSKLFVPLREFGVYHYSRKLKKYVWTFPVTKLTEVLGVLGRPIKINDTDLEVLDIKKKRLTTGPKQGEGFIKVKLHPTKSDYFQVTTVRERKPQNTNVSFGTVKKLWEVIKKQPKDKKVLTGTVAKNYCHKMGVTGFDLNGVFSWKYFSGSRKHYLLFYAAVKVLCHYGVIEHVVQASKSGITRKSDSWMLQTELV